MITPATKAVVSDKAKETTENSKEKPLEKTTAPAVHTKGVTSEKPSTKEATYITKSVAYSKTPIRQSAPQKFGKTPAPGKTVISENTKKTDAPTKAATPEKTPTKETAAPTKVITPTAKARTP